MGENEKLREKWAIEILCSGESRWKGARAASLLRKSKDLKAVLIRVRALYLYSRVMCGFPPRRAVVGTSSPLVSRCVASHPGTPSLSLFLCPCRLVFGCKRFQRGVFHHVARMSREEVTSAGAAISRHFAVQVLLTLGALGVIQPFFSDDRPFFLCVLS